MRLPDDLPRAAGAVRAGPGAAALLQAVPAHAHRQQAQEVHEQVEEPRGEGGATQKGERGKLHLPDIKVVVDVCRE